MHRRGPGARSLPGVAALLAALLAGCAARTLTPLPDDREYVFSIEDLRPYLGDDEYPAERGVLTKRRLAFDQYELVYEYDSDDPPFYLLWELVLHPSEGSARNYYRSGGTGLWLGSALSDGASFERDDDFVVWGDASRFYHIEADGEGVGNAFLSRSGRRTVLFLIAGFYFDTPDSFQRLVRPRLTNALRFQPESLE